MGSLVLLDLMGGVALLLWGLHMVHSGILRAFGPDLRSLLAKALKNRFAAFAAGIGLTALLQSSTATALIASSFTADGLVSLVPALAIMLGANVGTTLIVQVLSFNVAAMAPVLFVIGLVAFRSGARSWIKDVGRVSIGLGLMLLALHILLDTLAPAENAPGMRVFLNAITGDPALCIAIGAIVTWAVHSSVASVLLVMSLAYAHFISPFAALALVLGANLGSAINPVFEGAHRNNPASYRLPVGNLVNRLVGVLLVAPFLRPIADLLQNWQPDLAKMTAEFHTIFNIATAILFIGLLDSMAGLLKKLLPSRIQEVDPSRPRYLDDSALETPSLALADAARETLHMGDLVEVMLRQVMAAMMTNDRTLADRISRMDNSIDSLDEAIKLYMTKLTRGSLDEREGKRAMEIISFTINLEHIGDIIDKNLSELATKKIKRRFEFSPEGAEELLAFHKRTMDSLRIAFGVFMSGDVNEARKLLAEKALLRNAEIAATERHLDRLREGRPETIETTSLHLDVLRDLRRIHSHICSVAYPVLDTAGEPPTHQNAENDPAALPIDLSGKARTESRRESLPPPARRLANRI
ncbi:MAG: Na/Pi cotransporter family protein [Bradyrhizobium sp.]|uniref:Na/Pi cotransporter family protein n=1 Tax=Bradyrhizobium sp. TaxID=376 RepID=UPI002382876A|nr:Na/Pi cotransporter family protein [Bradyrhizobium sp.]MDE2330233.1 Na/Pi cotransporter family protein [Bradyrhizobium sp.]MDE2602335.1 Na/Pi cotransporter family protein [Bradyrhizobium sp.]